MGYFTVPEPASRASNNNLMPHMLLSRFVLRDVTYPHSQVFKVSYRSSRDALENLLPQGMRLAGEPVIHFLARHGKDLDWIVGGHANIFGVYVTAEYRGRNETVSGAYWPVLWEDDTMATIMGRELIGVAKMHADVSAPWRLGSEWRVDMSDRGHPLATLRVRSLRPMPEDMLAANRRAAAEASVLGWRQIPSLQGSEPALAHAVHLRSPTKIERAWVGEGEVQFHHADPAVHIWNAPILDLLRQVPLLEPVTATMSEGSGEHRLSGMRAIE
jgi:acetoacetate decarboxylase